MSNKPLKTVCAALNKDARIYCDRLKGHEGTHKGSKIITKEWENK